MNMATLSLVKLIFGQYFYFDSNCQLFNCNWNCTWTQIVLRCASVLALVYGKDTLYIFF